MQLEQAQFWMEIVNYSIIVLGTTIVYCLVLIPVRIYRISKQWERSERKFAQDVMLKFKTGEWKNGRNKNA